jgi:hypothetical protein
MNDRGILNNRQLCPLWVVLILAAVGLSCQGRKEEPGSDQMPDAAEQVQDKSSSPPNQKLLPLGAIDERRSFAVVSYEWVTVELSKVTSEMVRLEPDENGHEWIGFASDLSFKSSTNDTEKIYRVRLSGAKSFMIQDTPVMGSKWRLLLCTRGETKVIAGVALDRSMPVVVDKDAMAEFGAKIAKQAGLDPEKIPPWRPSVDAPASGPR